jgi:hypothetical protein
MICLLVIRKRQISIQQIGDGVTSLGTVSSDEGRRIAAPPPPKLLVFDVPM